MNYRFDSIRGLHDKSKQLYSGLEKAGREKAWRERIDDAQTVKYILTYAFEDINKDASAKETYEFILNMFEKKGFKKEEAIAYMIAHKSIFRAKVSRIISVLSVLDIIGCADETFFEYPEFIVSDYTTEQIYASVSAFKNKPYRVSILDIMSHLYMKKGEVFPTDKPLAKGRQLLLEKSYVGKLNRNIEKVLNKKEQSDNINQEKK